jgi:hypothetical protein
MRKSGLVLLNQDILELLILGLFELEVDFTHIFTTQLWVIYFGHFQ